MPRTWLRVVARYRFVMAEGVLIHSINASGIREVMLYGNIVTTRIFKEPVAGIIEANSLRIEGDAKADPTVHVGLESAVFLSL